jgi:hypothetical protein
VHASLKIFFIKFLYPVQLFVPGTIFCTWCFLPPFNSGIITCLSACFCRQVGEARSCSAYLKMLSSSRNPFRISAHSFWITSRSSAAVFAARIFRIKSRSRIGVGILQKKGKTCLVNRIIFIQSLYFKLARNKGSVQQQINTVFKKVLMCDSGLASLSTKNGLKRQVYLLEI